MSHNLNREAQLKDLYFSDKSQNIPKMNIIQWPKENYDTQNRPPWATISLQMGSPAQNTDVTFQKSYGFHE